MVSFLESSSFDAAGMNRSNAASPQNIRLLVCSANLGNAEPDLDSLAAWIPQNGFCHHVIRPDPPYPLAIPKQSSNQKQNVLQHSDTILEENDEDDEDDDDILNAEDPSDSDDVLPPFDPTKSAEKPTTVTIDPAKKQALMRSLLVWAKLLNLRMAVSQKRQLLETALPPPTPQQLTVSSTTQQFDIIVIGMQEATFEDDKTATNQNGTDAQKQQPQSPSHSNLLPTEDESSVLLVDGPSTRSLPFLKHHNPAKKVLKIGGKGAAAIAGLTATRDYTKQQHYDSGALSTHQHQHPTSNSSDHAFGFPRRDWGGGTAVLHAKMDSWLPSYKRAVSYQRGQMRLEVYVKQAKSKPKQAQLSNNDDSDSSTSNDDDDDDHEITVEILGTRAQNTGRGGLANKGGIVTELLVNGTTRLSFLTAHLEAHEGHSKFKKRVVSFAKILDGTKAERWHDVSQTSHFSFALGDLNFRTDLQDKSLPKEAHKRAIQKMVANDNWHGLNQADELHRALNRRACMVGYHTPLCNFPPTFKMAVHKGWEWQNKRRPSYTDRILYKANHDLQAALSPLVYEPIPDFATSDHKPIRAAFDVQLNPTFKMRPRIMRTENMVSSSKKKKAASLTNILSSKKKPDIRPEAIPVDDVEKVEVFVSDLSVQLYPKKNADKPNPYVALVSNPKEILHRGHKKYFLPRFIGRRHKKHWPQTSTQKGTWDPDWSDEEVKCKIKLHTDDGMPVDLTGALMQLTVLNKQKGPAIEDTVIGSCTFNLVPFLTRCRSQAQHLSAEQERRTPTRPDQSAFRGSVAAGRRRLSTMIFSMRAQPNPISVSSSVDSTEPITTVEVDDFLTKNGKVVGRIRGKIDGWWINQATAKVLHQSKQRRATQAISQRPDSFRTRRQAIVA